MSVSSGAGVIQNLRPAISPAQEPFGLTDLLSELALGGCPSMDTHEPDDRQLLREFAERHSEAAFAEIVASHADLVYSAALRQTANRNPPGGTRNTEYEIPATDH